MNLARIACVAASLVLVVSTTACSSSDEGTGSGTQNPKPSGGSSGETNKPTETSSSETCSSSALNGRCLKGPNKGASCCMPDGDEGITCKSGTDCSTVCRHCE